MDEVYLGDGAYAKFDGFQVELYTSNGLMKTNRIYLEGSALEAFVRFANNLLNTPAPRKEPDANDSTT